ncbi:hypothetical protein CEXT_291391 [Caerostris extrusa]|uniref:Uncharacterized protein n=1 Tax=Caerostris extrusa TaxID=172846 RepID=A0AAV4SF57_CAEEX|nr:hypothetical protein CEXT_291391 [Caerostris extrusa]
MIFILSEIVYFTLKSKLAKYKSKIISICFPQKTPVIVERPLASNLPPPQKYPLQHPTPYRPIPNLRNTIRKKKNRIICQSLTDAPVKSIANFDDCWIYYRKMLPLSGAEGHGISLVDMFSAAEIEGGVDEDRHALRFFFFFHPYCWMY